MDRLQDFRRGVCWAGGDCAGARAPEGRLSFDLNTSVHVFETTIRALGGLLSAHEIVSKVR